MVIMGKPRHIPPYWERVPFWIAHDGRYLGALDEAIEEGWSLMVTVRARRRANGWLTDWRKAREPRTVVIGANQNQQHRQVRVTMATIRLLDDGPDVDATSDLYEIRGAIEVIEPDEHLLFDDDPEAEAELRAWPRTVGR